MSKKRVYISSTFKDLKEYRSSIIDDLETVLSTNFELARIMERMYDKGNSKPNIEECIEEVKRSDIYVFILGDTVGSFIPNQTPPATYTELEYDAAIAAKEKKIFRFVKEIDEKEIDESVRLKYIDIKRKTTSGLPNATFKDLKDLKLNFLKSMCSLLDEKVDFNQKHSSRFEKIFGSILLSIGMLASSLAAYFLIQKHADIVYQIGIPIGIMLLTFLFIGILLKEYLSEYLN